MCFLLVLLPLSTWHPATPATPGAVRVKEPAGPGEAAAACRPASLRLGSWGRPVAPSQPPGHLHCGRGWCWQSRGCRVGLVPVPCCPRGRSPGTPASRGFQPSAGFSPLQSVLGGSPTQPAHWPGVSPPGAPRSPVQPQQQVGGSGSSELAGARGVGWRGGLGGAGVTTAAWRRGPVLAKQRRDGAVSAQASLHGPTPGHRAWRTARRRPVGWLIRQAAVPGSLKERPEPARAGRAHPAWSLGTGLRGATRLHL